MQGDFGDKYDKLNLKLSALIVRESLGPNLLARVIGLVGAQATGPELFLTAVHQISFMTASMVRSLCDDILNLSLKKVPGENVSVLGEKII